MLICAVLALSLVLVLPASAFAAVPDRVTLSVPADGATGVGTFPTLWWNTVSGATSYQVQISSNSSFSNIVFDKSTTSNSIVVRLRDLSSSFNGGGLNTNTNYWWRVRARNASGDGPWSLSRSFKTNLRQTYSPYDHNVNFGQTQFSSSGRFGQDATNFYAREQQYLAVRWRLWWESELRFADGRSKYYSQVVSTESNLPSYTFEFQPDEIGHQTRRPDNINANQYYWAGATLTKASNQPSLFNIGIESEITDWLPHPRAYWDVRRASGLVNIPFDQTWIIP